MYAVTWSIAACLIIGIGISSYFLFLKQNVGEDVFIAKEQPAATATVPAHKEDTSLSAPKMEPIPVALLPQRKRSEKI